MNTLHDTLHETKSTQLSESAECIKINEIQPMAPNETQMVVGTTSEPTHSTSTNDSIGNFWSIDDLLRHTAKSSNTREFTHSMTHGSQRLWSITPENLTQFWRGYCNSADRLNSPFGLAERSYDIMPVIANCTIKFSLEGLPPIHELYDEDLIRAVVYCYQQALIETLQLSDDKYELICVILQSERARFQDGLVRVDLRFQFPYCKVHVSTQSRVIQPKVIQLLQRYKVLARFRWIPTTDWEGIIDPMGPQEPVVMYKSIRPGQPKLVLTSIYGQIESLDQPARMVELTDAFRPLNHSHVQQGLVDRSMFDDVTDINHWLPMFLSVHYWSSVCQVRSDLVTEKSTPVSLSVASLTSDSSMNSVNSSTRLDNRTQTDLTMAKEFMPMLKQHRVDQDHYWLDVGRALYSSSQGSVEGLNEWIQFTNQSNAHETEECQRLYPTFEGNHLSVKTLAFYARQDSPEAYAEWHKEWYVEAMERAISCLENDVAQALYRVYWLDFVGTRVSSTTWYQFSDHRWVKQDSAIGLRQLIVDDFMRRYEHLKTYISQKCQEASDDGTRQSCEIMMKKITTLIAKLKTYPFKLKLINEAMSLFYDSKFERCLDSNPDLLGMKNCVIEISRNQAIARPGKPEDYIAMTTDLPYLHDLTWTSDVVRSLMRWMSQVFTDEGLRDYFLKMSASCLKGQNSDKIFPIWTGEGDNSKSMIVKLFETCFGGYCIKFPTTILTGKRTQSSAPMPEMARAKFSRIAILQEPDDNDAIQGGILKELTGGDSFFARALHDNGGDVKAMFKLILMCNKIPPIPTGGKAVKNRTRILPFMSTWVSSPPESEAEQYQRRLFKKDPFFERQIPNLARAFMWVLVQFYSRYMTEGLIEPLIIQEVTDRYWKSQDIYLQFLEDQYEPDPNYDPRSKTNFFITGFNFYKSFKSWHKAVFGDRHPVPDGQIFGAKMGAIFGDKKQKSNTMRYVGYRPRSIPEVDVSSIVNT
jgi:phage/plasmid-associated DNA primase